MKKIHIILVLLIINAGILLWWFSDTQVIKRQTNAFGETLVILKEEGKGARALKRQQLAGLLSDSLICSIKVKNYNYEFSKDELTQAHLAMTSLCHSSSAEASEISITIGSDTSATVTTTLDLSATEKGGQIHRATCRTELTWHKNDQGKWRLSTITIR